MELQLENRDYVPDGHGGVTGLRGMEALLARTLFRLTARRGALPFLPELGSRLYQLRRAKPVQWDSMARQYVAEALAGERELAVTEVAVRQAGERLWVQVRLKTADGQAWTVAVDASKKVKHEDHRGNLSGAVQPVCSNHRADSGGRGRSVRSVLRSGGGAV